MARKGMTFSVTDDTAKDWSVLTHDLSLLDGLRHEMEEFLTSKNALPYSVFRDMKALFRKAVMDIRVIEMKETV